MPISLEERTSFIPRPDYEHAYSLLEGQERGHATVALLFNHLEAFPDESVELDAKFIAILALFSVAGRKLAEALLVQAEIESLQRLAAREYASIGKNYPHLLADS